MGIFEIINKATGLLCGTFEPEVLFTVGVDDEGSPNSLIALNFSHMTDLSV